MIKMANKIKFSIIIPVVKINDYIRESLPYLLAQSYKNFEILIFPNKKEEEFKDKRVKVIGSGTPAPAEKRNLALKYAKGEILAFIDDDAYPNKDWLKNVLKNFEDERVGAAGGPNLTPKNNSKFQKTCGFVLSSSFVSGKEGYRNKVAKKREIEDCPSSNLFVRKEVFAKIKGFDPKYWPGEDTKLCLEIIKLGRKIIYDPKVVVYHHRRKNLVGYLKQIFSFAKHRGYFAKNLPETSLKLQYFIPSIFLIGLLIGPLLSLIHKYIFIAYSFLLSLYILLVLITSFVARAKGFSFFRSVYLIFLTHIVYGLGFIEGISKKNLESKFRE